MRGQGPIYNTYDVHMTSVVYNMRDGRNYIVGTPYTHINIIIYTL